MHAPPETSPISTTRAQAGGVSGSWSGSSSCRYDDESRGNRPTTVRHGGGVLGHGVCPSVSATTTSGRGRERSAVVKPDRRSVPPPPTSAMPSPRHSGCTVRAAASHDTTLTRSRRPPTAREIAAISRSAPPSSASLTDPEVSTTTQTRGGLRRRLGSTAPGTDVERRDGRPYV